LQRGGGGGRPGGAGGAARPSGRRSSLVALGGQVTGGAHINSQGTPRWWPAAARGEGRDGLPMGARDGAARRGGGA
jgi:hypothetical protein